MALPQWLDLDAARPLEAGLCEWLDGREDPRQATKDLLLLGYSVVASGALCRFGDAPAPPCGELAELRSQIQLLDDEHRRLTQEKDACCRVLQGTVTQRDALIQQLTEALTRAAPERDLCELVRRSVEEPHRQQVSALQARLDALGTELALLKRSNGGKGVQGELAVENLLRGLFPAYEVLDVSQTGGGCDLHVHVDGDGFFAVECKNKERVTAQDVDKFLRDSCNLSEQHGRRFLGALFLSLRTPNIPGRGDFAFEVTGGAMRPLVFLGLALDLDCLGEAPPVLEFSVRVLLEAARTCRAMDSAAVTLRDMQRRLEPLVGRVRALRREIEGLKDGASRILRTCDHMWQGLTGIFEEFASMGLAKGADARTSGSEQRCECRGCGRSFQAPKGLARHQASCPALCQQQVNATSLGNHSGGPA
jgi:HAMP domain-containing protein